MDEKITEVEQLKRELKGYDCAIDEFEQKIRNLSSSLERFEMLESEVIFSRDHALENNHEVLGSLAYELQGMDGCPILCLMRPWRQKWRIPRKLQTSKVRWHCLQQGCQVAFNSIWQGEEHMWSFGEQNNHRATHMQRAVVAGGDMNAKI
eukprot:Gb_01119 [translate_table: standard]